MNLYNKWVSLSEMSDQKYWPFSLIQFFLDVPVYAVDYVRNNWWRAVELLEK